jgi:branched-chain amino acid transport system substrate-binding protein
MKKGLVSSWLSGQRGLLTVVMIELVVVAIVGWIIIQNVDDSRAGEQALTAATPRSATTDTTTQLNDAPVASEAIPAGEDGGAGAPGVGGSSPSSPPLPGQAGAATSPGPSSGPAGASATKANQPGRGGGATASGASPSGPTPTRPAAGPSGPVTLDRGVTDTTISIGSICHISGPLRLEFGCVGADAAAKEINAAGGVGGRRLLYKYYDDGLDPQRTKAAVTKLLQEDKVFAWVAGWAPVTANVTIPAFEQDQTPIVFPDSTDNLWFTNPWVFPYGTSVRGYGIATCDYLLKTVKDPKIAIVYYDVRPSIQPKDACVGRLKERGVAPASVDQAQLGAPDFTNLVLKWRSLGVNAVAVFIEENSHVRLAQNLDQQNYWIPQVGNGTAASSTIAEQAPRGGEGITLVGPTRSYLGDSPVAQRYREAMKRFFPRERLHGLGLLAYAQMYQFAETVKLLGTNLTRTNLKQVLESLDADTQGVLGTRLNYRTPRGRDFDNCFGTWKVRGRAWADADGGWFCY